MYFFLLLMVLADPCSKKISDQARDDQQQSAGRSIEVEGQEVWVGTPDGEPDPRLVKILSATPSPAGSTQAPSIEQLSPAIRILRLASATVKMATRPVVSVIKFPIKSATTIGVSGVVLGLALTFSQSIAMVKGTSMEPCLRPEQRCWVNRFFPSLGTPARGDIIVFRSPQADNPGEVVKRIIGLPGDHIELQHGLVFLNGKALEEPYLAPGTRTDGALSPGFTVPEGHLFVLGDHRDNSLDSRDFGPIRLSDVSARLVFRFW